LRLALASRDRLDDDVLAAQRRGPRHPQLGRRRVEVLAVARLDEREPRGVALHERLAREQELDVELEEAQLERGDVLLLDHEAFAIDRELERGLACGELGLLLVAAAR